MPTIAEQKHDSERSPQWPEVRAKFLKDHPSCEACGGTQNLEVHHKMPFHLDKSLELDPSNLITLCETAGYEHHLMVGHLDDWESYNPNVVADAKRLYGMTKAQIAADGTWQVERGKRPRQAANAL